MLRSLKSNKGNQLPEHRLETTPNKPIEGPLSTCNQKTSPKPRRETKQVMGTCGSRALSVRMEALAPPAGRAWHYPSFSADAVCCSFNDGQPRVKRCGIVVVVVVVIIIINKIDVCRQVLCTTAYESKMK